MQLRINKLNSKGFFTSISLTGREYNIDDFHDNKKGVYWFEGADTGTNKGIALPSLYISAIVQVGTMQVALGMDNIHYVRYYWGEWKDWKKINSNGEISDRLQVLWQDQDSSGQGSGLKIIVDNNTTLFLSYDKFESIK